MGPFRVSCRVVAIDHDEAALTPVGLRPGAQLPAFSAQGTLTFEHGRGWPR